MFSFGSKATAITAAIVGVLGLQTWGFVSTRNTLEGRLTELQQEIESVRQASAAALTQIESNLDSDLQVVSEKIGVTNKDLAEARRTASLLRQEQAKTAANLRSELENNSQAVSALRHEASSRITELTQSQNDNASKIGAVTGDVQVVKSDLDTTKKDLASSRREMLDMRDSLGREIARNSTEVAELRRRGERDYQEFSVPKTKNMERLVTGVQIQLKKADTKAQKYDILMVVDDSKIEKKGQAAKEPIQFLVGRDRLRYELVVYSVDKDRIRGYVSMPKDGVLSAEGPRLQ
jgi:hypothetical protein